MKVYVFIYCLCRLCICCPSYVYS